MTKTRCVCVRKRPQTSASIRKRPQASASVRGASGMLGSRKLSRNAELSSFLGLRLALASQKSQQSRGSQGVVVAKRRTVVTFGLALRLHVLKVTTFAGIWSRKQNCHHFRACVWSPRLNSVNNLGDRRGSWSRNAELSSLFDLRCVFTS